MGQLNQYENWTWSAVLLLLLFFLHIPHNCCNRDFVPWGFGRLAPKTSGGDTKRHMGPNPRQCIRGATGKPRTHLSLGQIHSGCLRKLGPGNWLPSNQFDSPTAACVCPHAGVNQEDLMRKTFHLGPQSRASVCTEHVLQIVMRPLLTGGDWASNDAIMKCQTCTQPEGGESVAAERVVAHVCRLYAEPCGTCAETCMQERATVN